MSKDFMILPVPLLYAESRRLITKITNEQPKDLSGLNLKAEDKGKGS